jgi:putative FmdB family regulatory protein
MPTYEFRCPTGHVFEKFYPSMNDTRRARCPTCGKQGERQISGGAGLVFKGSGFYITDYKRPAAPEAGEKPGESAKGGAAESSQPADRSQKKKPRAGDQ